MHAATIGFTREDGDFEILATMTNTAGHYGTPRFIVLVQSIAETIAAAIGHEVEILEREDAPEVVTID